MSSKNRDGKPTKFQLDALKALKANMKGIKTYRDAENALKRLRKHSVPAPVKKVGMKKGVPVCKEIKKPVCAVKKALARKDAADKCITMKGKTLSSGKCITVKTAKKKPISGTDEVRIALPSCKCSGKDDCRHLTVEISIVHDDIFTPIQMKNIDKLSAYCSDTIVQLCNEFAEMNGLIEKPSCTFKRHGQKKIPAKKPAKLPNKKIAKK